MFLLGIETSCDESSAAIVEAGKNILSNVVMSQVKDHAVFHGVVPELASRMHLEAINAVIEEAFCHAGLSYSDIAAVAVVHKPGLVGSLLIGLSTAKAFAYQLGVPLVPVNHIEAHLYAPHLEQDIPFPNIGLAVSGGHTLVYHSKSYTEHSLIGSTIDDAVGEAFDKVAKHFDLGYPGGPIIDGMARDGDFLAYKFPRAKYKDDNPYQFSYSGLKTAVIHQLNKFHAKGHGSAVPDILASFQKAAIDVLLDVAVTAARDHGIQDVVVSGGVSCNSYMRSVFKEHSEITAYFASPKLSTDNGAMVAGLAYHLLKEGITADYSLNAHSKIVKQGRALP
ncbi:MAG: tRNA (adenosine(37)-N6)-threonylcarbamoyltransferase complex transferase subunit TsaD [Spirochaetota bacterium]|nr:tRNA (adenosine(37)-N6)-threonylcarbamoyltransferase complex transferase subunit TsaD [Spirochaetota bacterium]